MPLDRDSRSLKMVSEYRGRGCVVLPLIWSRGDFVDPGLEYAAIYDGKGGYGRRLGNLWARVKWIWFLAVFICRNRNRFDTIHSVDLDVGIITVPLGRILRKHVIYDAFDQMASFFNPGFISHTLAALERLIIKRSSLTIFPDSVRLKQYGISSKHKSIIIGNIPDIDSKEKVTCSRLSNSRENSDILPLHFVYVGTLEATHRALEFIPRICDELKKQVTFSVAGVGLLEEFFSIEASTRPNLRFFGQLPYNDAKILMASADCLYGPYLLTTASHQYASPNKMYEHLALGKPLLTNRSTPVGDLVSQEQSGFVFDGTYDDLLSLIRKMSRQDCIVLGKKAITAWQKRYSQLRSKQLKLYFDALQSL